MASVLAIGGAIKYQVKQGAQVSDSFILGNVVPHTSQLLNQKVTIILGKALLWEVFDDDNSGTVELEEFLNIFYKMVCPLFFVPG